MDEQELAELYALAMAEDEAGVEHKLEQMATADLVDLVDTLDFLARTADSILETHQ